MIAVEWEDVNKKKIRTGLLISTAATTFDRKETVVGNVITMRQDGDPWVHGTKRPEGDYPKVILSIPLSRLIVKGVHIPFEPHGGSK